MDIIQSPAFQRTAKKLHANEKIILHAAIRDVVANPDVGALKKADLIGLRVYKFKMQHQLTLLAYRFDVDNQILYLVAFGPHENFYRDLSRSLH